MYRHVTYIPILLMYVYMHQKACGHVFSMYFECAHVVDCGNEFCMYACCFWWACIRHVHVFDLWSYILRMHKYLIA